MKLSELKNPGISKKRRKRVGRGPGSKRGKTSGRGHKGAKSRSGYKERGAQEGGGLPLFQKVPGRGFSRKRFARPYYTFNLERLDALFDDGETINIETLKKKGFSRRRLSFGFKVLAKGDLTKKVVLEANAFTKQAVLKLEKQGVEFKRID